MRVISRVKAILVASSVLGMTFPAGVKVEAASPKSPAMDVALQADGMLKGQVLDATGQARPQATVAVYRDGQPLVQTKTDSQGRFTAKLVRSGEYMVVTNQAASLVRAWAQPAAPPSAVQGVLLVPNSTQLRGNNAGGMVDRFGLGALLVTGGAAAILIATLDENDAS